MALNRFAEPIGYFFVTADQCVKHPENALYKPYWSIKSMESIGRGIFPEAHRFVYFDPV